MLIRKEKYVKVLFEISGKHEIFESLAEKGAVKRKTQYSLAKEIYL